MGGGRQTEREGQGLGEERADQPTGRSIGHTGEGDGEMGERREGLGRENEARGGKAHQWDTSRTAPRGWPWLGRGKLGFGWRGKKLLESEGRRNKNSKTGITPTIFAKFNNHFSDISNP